MINALRFDLIFSLWAIVLQGFSKGAFLFLFDKVFTTMFIQSNLAIKNGLIRNKLVLRNHFLWPICHLLHKDKELLALRNNSRANKFLIAEFDCTSIFLALTFIYFSDIMFQAFIKLSLNFYFSVGVRYCLYPLV